MNADVRVIKLDSFEHRLLIRGMADFRNLLIETEKPTEDVDDLLLKIIDAPTKKEMKRDRREKR